MASTPQMPTYKPTANGMVAVTPDGKIIQAGTYTFTDRPNAPPTYKIYQGPGGRLFRSYNPGIHGHAVQTKYVVKQPGYTSYLPATNEPGSYRWEWSPQSDYAIWNNAQAAFKKSKGGGTAGAQTGAAAGGAGAASAGSTAGGAGTAAADKTVPFDYAKWLANEPTLQAALRQINAAGLTQGAQLVGGEQQIFGRLGEAPDLSAPQYANLSPELRAALSSAITPELKGIIDQSNQAGTSALARLNSDYRLGQSQDVHALGGMGALRSGAYGQESAKNLRELTLGQYDKRQGALDTLGELQSTYLTNQQTLAGQAQTAVTEAQQRAAGMISLGQLGPVTVPQVTNPYLSPAAATSVARPVTVGGATSLEPHATAGNIVPQAAPMAPTPPLPKAAPYKRPSLGFKALR